MKSTDHRSHSVGIRHLCGVGRVVVSLELRLDRVPRAVAVVVAMAFSHALNVLDVAVLLLVVA